MARRLWLLAGMSCLLLGPAPSRADPAWLKSENAWAASDRCARSAYKQFPDYTPEGNAKRQHALQQCLQASNLPPRDAPPPAAAAAAAPPAAGQPPH
jgi:hypothetical protein